MCDLPGCCSPESGKSQRSAKGCVRHVDRHPSWRSRRDVFHSATGRIKFYRQPDGTTQSASLKADEIALRSVSVEDRMRASLGLKAVLRTCLLLLAVAVCAADRASAQSSLNPGYAAQDAQYSPSARAGRQIWFFGTAFHHP